MAARLAGPRAGAACLAVQQTHENSHPGRRDLRFLENTTTPELQRQTGPRGSVGLPERRVGTGRLSPAEARRVCQSSGNNDGARSEKSAPTSLSLQAPQVQRAGSFDICPAVTRTGPI